MTQKRNKSKAKDRFIFLIVETNVFVIFFADNFDSGRRFATFNYIFKVNVYGKTISSYYLENNSWLKIKP